MRAIFTNFSMALAVIGALAAPANAAELETIFFSNTADAVEPRAQAMLRRDPTDRQASAWMALSYMKQGKFEQARTALAKAGTQDLTGLLAHGDFSWYTGEFAAAHTHYQAALKIEPTDAHARWGVASAHLHLGAYDQALTIAQALALEARQHDADFQAWVLVLVGGAQAMKADQGNMVEKVRFGPQVKGTFEQALALSPKNPNVLSAIGRFALLAPSLLGGDKAKAVEYLRRADTMDPFFYLNDAYLIRALIADKQPGAARVEAAFYQAKFNGLKVPAEELAKITL